MTTTAIGASRVASERRSGSEFVQSNECDAIRADERARIVAWLRKYAEPEDDGTWHINDAAGQIERGEYLELRHDPARKPPE